MTFKQLVSVLGWGVAVAVVVPTSASRASARDLTADDAIALEGSQCWGRCSACTTRCAQVFGSDRERCERTCQAGNERCCESTGRHGASRACGCY